MVVLGLDFGLRHVGVACADTQTFALKPLGSIRAQRGRLLLGAWAQLDQWVGHWHPHQWVLGHPLNMDGSTGSLERHVQAFSRKIKRRYGGVVHLEDERLSTCEARQRVFSASGYRGLMQQDLHGQSACIILEQWLHQEASP
jgi:putative holliday junction resolvase